MQMINVNNTKELTHEVVGELKQAVVERQRRASERQNREKEKRKEKIRKSNFKNYKWVKIPLRENKITNSYDLFVADFIGYSDPLGPEEKGVVRGLSFRQPKQRSVIPDTSELGTYQPREKKPWNGFTKLYGVVEPKDIYDLMDCSSYLESIAKSFSSSEIPILEDYLVQIYRENYSLEDIQLALNNFDILEKTSIKIAKGIYRKNKKVLNQLLDHYLVYKMRQKPDQLENSISESKVSNIDSRPLDVVEEQGLYSSITDTITATKDSADSIKQLADRINIVASQSQSNLVNITKNVSEATDKVNKISEKIEESVSTTEIKPCFTLLDNIKRHALTLSWNIFELFKAETLKDFMFIAVNICSLLDLDQALVNKLMDLWKPKQNHQLQEQGSRSVKLLALISACLGKHSPVHMLTGSSAFVMAKEVKAVEELHDLLYSVAEEWGIINSPEAEMNKMLKKDVSELIVALTEHQYQFTQVPGKYLFNVDYDKFISDYKRLEEVKLILLNVGRGMDVNQVNIEVTRLDRAYKKLKENIEHVRRGSATRQEPVALAFLGEPGIGKTVFTRTLVSGEGLIPSLLVKRFNERNLYEKREWRDSDVRTWQTWYDGTNSDTPFDVNFTGQQIHYADDFFQKTDDSDHLRFVNFISPTKYPTNQAPLELKGLPYECKLVVGTCNKFPQTSKVIKEIGALHRRFMVVKVKARNQIPTGLLDKSFDHLEFTVWKDGSDYFANKHPETLTTEQLVDRILDNIEEKARFYQSTLGEEFEEQSRPSNLKEVTRTEFMRVVRNLDLNNFSDLYNHDYCFSHNQARSPFNGLFLKDRQGLPNTRLIELVRHAGFVKYSTLSFLLEHYKEWDMQRSERALEKLAEDKCYYVTRNFGIAFAMVRDVPTVYVLKDHSTFYQAEDEESDPTSENYQKPPEDREEDDPWYKWAYENLTFWIVCDNLRQYIYQTAMSTYNYCAEAIKIAYHSFEEFKNYVSSFSVLEAIISYLTPIGNYFSNNYRYLVSLVASGVVSSIASYVLLLLYSKVTQAISSDNLCSSCNTNEYKLNYDQCMKFREQFCRKHCNQGIFKSDHTVDCKSFEGIIHTFLATICRCEGDCYDECRHANNWDDRSIQLLASRVSTFNNKAALEILYQFATEEDSSTSIKGLKKRKFAVNEDSSTSIKGLPKKRFIAQEDSSTSIKGLRKKKFIHQEDSSTSIKGLKKKQFVTTTTEEISQIRQFVIDEEPNLVEQIQMDPSASAIARNVLPKICFQAERVLPGCNIKQTLYGMAYKNFFITPGHLWNDNIHASYSFTDNLGNIRKLKLLTLKKNCDIAVWTFEGSPMSQDLERHMIKRRDFESKFDKNFGAMLIVQNGNQQIVHMADCIKKEALPLIVNKQERTYETIYKVHGFSSSNTSRGLDTASGDCGSPLILQNTQCERKIIGFHILGSDSVSYSAVLYWELLQSMFGNVKEEISFASEGYYHTNGKFSEDSLSLVKDEQIDGRLQDTEAMPYIGKYIHKTRPSNGKTNILEHRLHGAFPIKTVPAPLHVSQVEDPSKLHLDGWGQPNLLQTQLNKYSHQETFVPGLEEHLEHMVDQLSEHYIHVLGDKDLSISNDEEVYTGRVDVSYSLPLKLDTSPGEPFATFFPETSITKKHFLKSRRSESGQYIYSTNTDIEQGRKLMEIINHKEALAKRGQRTVSLWKNCLKDETRPIEKAKIGKTRLFTAAPLDTVYLFRKYFGKFKEEWQQERNNLFHSVGINPVSQEWTILANKLLSKGTDFSDADFGSFDGRLRSDFMRAAGKIIRNTINYHLGHEENDLIMETLWEECVETFHLSEDDIHLTTHGNPSGNPMTTVVNCMVNFLYHWYAYIRISGKQSLTSFVDQVGFTCFGDDVVFSSLEDITDYSFENVSKIMLELGQEYTTAQKDGVIHGRRTIGDITFLKRSFVKYGSMYLAPLDRDSIEQQFNYTNIGINCLDDIHAQIKQDSIEAAILGQDYYNEFRTKLMTALRRDKDLYKTTGPIQTYSDARQTAIARISELGVSSLKTFD